MIDKHASDLHLYRKLCLIILVLGYQRCSRRRRRRFLLDRSTRQSVIHRWDYINNRMRTSWKKNWSKIRRDVNIDRSNLWKTSSFHWFQWKDICIHRLKSKLNVSCTYDKLTLSFLMRGVGMAVSLSVSIYIISTKFKNIEKKPLHDAYLVGGLIFQCKKNIHQSIHLRQWMKKNKDRISVCFCPH